MLDTYTYDSYSNKKVFRHYIFNSCSERAQALPIKEMSAGQAGNYLLVLWTNITDWVKVHVEIELDRYEYFISEAHNSTTHTMCTISSHTQDSCTTATQDTYGSITGLISVHSDQLEIDWHETISITKACNYRWATWTAIWLPVLVLNVAIFTVLFVAVYIAAYKKYSKRLINGMQANQPTETEREPLLQETISVNTQGYRTNDADTVPAANNGDTESNSPANTDQGAASDVGPSTGSQSVEVAIDIEHNSDPVTTMTSLDPQSVEVGYVATSTSDSSQVDDATVTKTVSDNKLGEGTPIL